MEDQAIDGASRFWTVPAEEGEVRLDRFARRCLPHLSRRALEQAIGDRLFRINGKIAKKGARLRSGDALSFTGPAIWLTEAPEAAKTLSIPIIYEDSALLVVNKPAGIATHGFAARETVTLANFLVAARPELYRVGTSAWEPGLVHRLDRETSGALLVAKTQPAFERLREQFRRRQIKKQYLALVWGKTEVARSISYPLAHDSRDSRRMRIFLEPRRGGRTRKHWRAKTRFRKLGEAQGFSLLEIEMETGVTHQIRVHLAAVGHPIVGDALYGDPDCDRCGLLRHFLHARSLMFTHPQHGATVNVEAGLPDDLQAVLDDIKIIP